MDSYGIGIQKIVDSIRDANWNIPAGSIKEDARNYSIRTVGEFASANEIEKVPINLTDSADGSKNVIKVGDIAKITDTVAEPTRIVRLNGQPSVVFTIQKQSGANTVKIADGI